MISNSIVRCRRVRPKRRLDDSGFEVLSATFPFLIQNIADGVRKEATPELPGAAYDKYDLLRRPTNRICDGTLPN